MYNISVLQHGSEVMHISNISFKHRIKELKKLVYRDYGKSVVIKVSGGVL